MGRIIRIDTLKIGDRHSCSSNGDGVRVVVWFSGCEIKCDGCHNSEYWDFDNDNFEEYSDKHLETVIQETKLFENNYAGLSVLGGEPFSKHNIKDVIKLCEGYLKEFPNKNIWIWSGYKYEWLKSIEGEYGEDIQKLFNLCSYLVDGPFIAKLRNISLKFRGSSNQRIISLKDGKEVC